MKPAYLCVLHVQHSLDHASLVREYAVRLLGLVDHQPKHVLGHLRDKDE